MDPRPQDRCKWPGDCIFYASPGGLFCSLHRRQHFENHALQPGKNDAFRNSSSNPPPSIPRDPTTTRLGNGSGENGLLKNPHTSRILSPKSNKKQLPTAGLARKTVKQPANLEQTHAHLASSTQGLSSEVQTANPRPLKRQRVSGVPNLSEPQLRSNSSSFSENGIPPSSKRGMLRQSEERTYKLSAIDDFALRPKKKDAAVESARSNASNDRRQPQQGDSRPSSSSQQALPPSQQPQSIGLNGNVRLASHAISPASLVIDLTADDSERLQPQPKPQPQAQPPPKSFVPNGITGVGHQIPKQLHDGNQIRNVVTPDNKQGREGPTQSRGIAQIKHGPSVEQASRNLVNKSPQNVIPSAPSNSHIAQATRPQTNGVSPKIPGNQQKFNAPTQNNGLGPVHMDTSDPANNPHNAPPIKQTQAVNGTYRPAVEEKTSIPIKGWTPINSVINSTRNGTKPEQSAVKKVTKGATKASTQTLPMAEAISSIPKEARVMSPGEIRHKEPPIPPIPSVLSKQNMQSTPVTLTKTCQPRPLPTAKQGPLTALLGGREWKKMSPEERRLFWVSQHDPKWFDAQIYSENNRPFRPGDPLFGLPESDLPPRPTQPATHFDYVDPRPQATPRRFEYWLKTKRDEISARGNRKANFGKAIKRTARRKRAAPSLSEEQRRDALPQRVRDDPNWLAAVGILEQIEAQTREKRKQQQQQQSHSRENDTITKDSSKVQTISTNDSFFACKDGVEHFDNPYE